MTIVGTGGGGGGGSSSSSTASDTGDTDTGDTGTGDTGTGDTGTGDVVETSMISFNVDTAKSLITTENAASTSAALRSLRKDGKAIPTLTFRKPTTKSEAEARKAEGRALSREEIDVNLIGIDEDGVAFEALSSSEELNVMYTVLSPDEKTVYIVLDPDFMHNSSQTIGLTNCMMFAVDLETNNYTCLDPGFAPQKMDNDFRQTISNSTVKPIQMDDAGTIYYLGRPFTVEENTWCNNSDQDGNCVNEQTDYWVNLDWSIQPVIRRISVQTDADGNPLYDENGYLSYQDQEDITPDNNYISSFLVSRDGILVYTYFNQESGDGGIKMFADGSTNALTGDDTSGWWGDMFYVIGDGGTVIYGSGSSGWGTGGVKFAQRHPVYAGGRLVYQLDTSLFTSRNTSPTPARIILGDDGYIYGLFNEDTGHCDESGCTQQARINLFRILPYKQTPIISIDVTGNWWDAMRGFDVQISKGYAYYVQTDSHPTNAFSARDVIKITKLATGDTTTLLYDTSWAVRYQLYSWKLISGSIHFSGFDYNASTVVTGEIDVTKVRQGLDSSEYLTISEAASALGESASIRDMEVLAPVVVTDPVGAPVITNIYTDPENLYSVSIDFSKYMNRSDVNSKLSFVNEANGADWVEPGLDAYGELTGEDVSANPSTMKVWSYRTLHLIIDNAVLDDDGYVVLNATTDPLDGNTMYEVSVLGTAFDAADWQLDMADTPYLAKSFTTVPETGWYQSTSIELDDYSDGIVGRYVKAEDADTGLEFYRLLGTKDSDTGAWAGSTLKNFQLELSVQYLSSGWHDWRALEVRLNDARKLDWASVDWSEADITDTEGDTWVWEDGYRTDPDTSVRYSWCNYENCEKPMEVSEWVDGVYRQNNGYIYIREEGCDVDVDGNTYYWYWDDEALQGGYQKYDSNGKSGDNLLATIVWVEGYYTDEAGTIYIWSFGEYRNENVPDDIIDWESGEAYTWHSGYHKNEDTGEVFEMPWIEWVPGKYVATYNDNGDPIPSDDALYQDEFSENSWWSWDESMGSYVEYTGGDLADPSGETTTWWDDSWMTVASPATVENTKKDDWEARLFRFEFDPSGNIWGEYRTGDWNQSPANDDMGSDGQNREWRKIMISVYGANLVVSVLDGDGDEIAGFTKTDYESSPQDGTGYFFLDLNVNSSVLLDNVVVTELNESGDPVEGDLLFEELFSSSTLGATWSDPEEYTSEW